MREESDGPQLPVTNLKYLSKTAKSHFLWTSNVFEGPALN